MPEPTANKCCEELEFHMMTFICDLPEGHKGEHASKDVVEVMNGKCDVVTKWEKRQITDTGGGIL